MMPEISSLEFERCGFHSSINIEKDIEHTHDWVRGFVMNPHPHLGRGGDVCPYVRKAHGLQRLFYNPIVVDLHSETETIEDQIVRNGLELLEDFLISTDPNDSQSIFDARVLIVGGLEGEESFAAVERAQRAVKDVAVASRIMIGEFHPSLRTPGIRAKENSGFFPLMSPIPMLVFRRMHITDLRFLTETPHHLNSYLRFYHHTIVPRTKRYETLLSIGLESEEHRKVIAQYFK